MKYELDHEFNGVKIYACIDDDGISRSSCTENDTSYQAWLNPKAEQSTPMVTDETASL
jgi:hypothetical protein